ncbi:hypothetical protein QC764_208360 [Podospora pseudoanserina]|uniref:DUF7025 domain-containing protein n=1 Tax=Podospora pseudoanserina TaxID=2609844 RepID=A0ABR0IJ83_9PEZI|nr:hypothetical protein QC764_208360 [Podospora pseudoanserina]
MVRCAPSRGHSKADDSNRVQVFHYEPDTSDSYSDSSDYVEQNARSPSFLSRVFKPKKKWQDAAVQVYKRHQGDNLYIHKVRLQSPQLKEALKGLLELYGLVYRDDSVMVESLAPHRALFFVRHHVAELAKMSKDDETSAHCSLLSGIIQEIFKDKFEEIETLNKEEKITFELLWTLYPEGSIFGTQLADEVPRAYKVNKITLTKEKVEIKCETIMFSGYSFRRYFWNVGIERFDGEIDRLQIPIIPYIDLACNRGLCDRLIQRGRKALDFQVPRYMEYDPEACRDDAVASPWVWKGSDHKLEKEKVVVDFFLVRKRVPYRFAHELLPGYKTGTRMGAKKFRRATPEEIDHSRHVVMKSTDNLLIMSPYVSGFSLSKRTYADFELDALKPIKRDLNAMEKVIFDDTKKAILKTLVENQRLTAQNQDGRNRALVISISGPSGTGKTLLAESVAAFTGQPLLKNWDIVRDTFEEARDWDGCILVEKPSLGPLPAQLDANAFVKELENFNGIVIVTSPGRPFVAPAIASRAQLHINLRYPSLFERKRLWELFNDQLPNDVGKLTSSELELLAAHPTNGYAIKNLLDVSAAWCRSLHRPISFDMIVKLREDTATSGGGGPPPPPPPPAGMGWPPRGPAMPSGMGGRVRGPPLGPIGTVVYTSPPRESKKKVRRYILVSDDDNDNESEQSISTLSSDDDDKSLESDSDTSRD